MPTVAAGEPHSPLQPMATAPTGRIRRFRWRPSGRCGESRDRFSAPVRGWTLLSELEDLSNRPIHPAKRLADDRLQKVTEVRKVEHSQLSAGYRIAD